MRAEDEAHSLICAVDQSLADCIKLLAEVRPGPRSSSVKSPPPLIVPPPQGCPPDQVEGVLSRLPPISQKFAKFWICRARLMELEGNLDVLPLFQEAVRVVLEVSFREAGLKPSASQWRNQKCYSGFMGLDSVHPDEDRKLKKEKT